MDISESMLLEVGAWGNGLIEGGEPNLISNPENLLTTIAQYYQDE
jgi:hypothetical protein